MMENSIYVREKNKNLCKLQFWQNISPCIGFKFFMWIYHIDQQNAALCITTDSGSFCQQWPAMDSNQSLPSLFKTWETSHWVIKSHWIIKSLTHSLNQFVQKWIHSEIKYHCSVLFLSNSGFGFIWNYLC